MNKSNDIKIPLDSNVAVTYGMLKRMNFKHFLALGEFVDNSVQSFLDNKELIQELNPKQKSVQVVIDSRPESIIITDNAGGISPKEFNHAFKLAKPEALKTKESLNEFGVGMKTAALWLGDRFEVETSAIGENVKHRIIFDLDEIQERELDFLDQVTQEYEDDFKSYTIITITKLNNALAPSHYNESRDHLSDIYRHYLNSGELILKTKTKSSGVESIKYEDPPILKAEYFDKIRSLYSPPNIKKIPKFNWEKTFKFDMPSPINFVKGRAFISEGASQNNNSGIVIFRRGRAVKGTGKRSSSTSDPRYRPKEIFTTATNHVLYQTLFIEAEVGPDSLVTSSKQLQFSDKDGTDLESTFIEKLLEVLEGDKKRFKELIDNGTESNDPEFIECLPLKSQATNVGRDTLKKDKKKKHAEDAVEEVVPHVKNFKAGEILNDKDLTSLPKSDLKQDEDILAEEIIPLLWNSTEYTMNVRVVDMSRKDWYLYKFDKKTNEVSVSITMKHPFSKKFLDAKGTTFKSHVRIAAGLALSEILANKTGKSPETMRRIFNKFLMEDLS